MKRIRRWFSRLFLRLCVGAWVRAVGPGRPEVHVQVVAHRVAGRLHYVILNGLGEDATAVDVSNLFRAMADIGVSLPGLDRQARRACGKLDQRMKHLQDVAQARTREKTKSRGRAA